MSRRFLNGGFKALESNSDRPRGCKTFVCETESLRYGED
jgi:hypothetical protein